MTHYIEATGGPDGWNIAYYVFTACRGLLFFTVVVLIGALLAELPFARFLTG